MPYDTRYYSSSLLLALFLSKYVQFYKLLYLYYLNQTVSTGYLISCCQSVAMQTPTMPSKVHYSKFHPKISCTDWMYMGIFLS